MKRRLSSIAGSGLAIFLLFAAGCGSANATMEITENAVSLDKKGGVKLYLVEDFDKEYYDLEELSLMATKEVMEFNGAIRKEEGTQRPVWVEDVSLLEGEPRRICLVYSFENPGYYTDFQKEALFVESVETAVSSGRIFLGSVLQGKEGTITLDEAETERLGKKEVIISSSRMKLYPPGEVLYYSPEAILCEDGSVDMTGCSDGAVIILNNRY